MAPVADDPRPCDAAGALDRLMPTDYPPPARAIAQAGWQPDVAGDYCRRCGATAPRQTQTDTGCPHCRDATLPWHRCWRLDSYRPPVSRWICELKYMRRWAWAPAFGQRLGEAIAADAPDHPARVAIVPIPLHWTRRLSRRFDQARLLAEAIAQPTGYPVAPVLRRIRRTAMQSQIRSHQQRLENVRNAFAVKPVDLHGWRIVLVDDVKTSGATAGQCVRLLRRAGAVSVDVAVVAVADPRGGDFMWNRPRPGRQADGE